ncbi:MAG: hypothetical protein ABIL40_11795 [candidate division WOR-3 bacterium]
MGKSRMWLTHIFFSFVLLNAQKYETTLRLFFNPTGGIVVLPKYMDYRISDLAIVYKAIGLDTRGFRVIHNANFTSDGLALTGFIAPAYIYFVPWSAQRKSFEIIPLSFYLYSGMSAWGFKEETLIDLAIGITHYFLSLRMGFNAVRAESRLFFNVDDPGFNDFSINWKSFYLAFDFPRATDIFKSQD